MRKPNTFITAICFTSKAYTSPKLIRVLESQGIKYFTDANGKPFTTRAAIEGALTEEDQPA